MKLILFFSLVLVFVLGVNNEGIDYDYFHLVLQWPESYCNTGKVTCYDRRPNWFIIHGMWPQKNGYTVSCPKISNKARYFNSEEVIYIFFSINTNFSTSTIIVMLWSWILFFFTFFAAE